MERITAENVKLLMAEKPEKFKQYRKKPVVITATRLLEPVEIETLEGVMRGDVGDLLIIGVNGEPYACKPDIFDKTYEPVDEARND